MTPEDFEASERRLRPMREAFRDAIERGDYEAVLQINAELDQVEAEIMRSIALELAQEPVLCPRCGGPDCGLVRQALAIGRVLRERQQ